MELLSGGGGGSLQPPPLDCATCEFLMGVYDEIAGNSTTLRDFIELFDEACSVIAPGTAFGPLCDVLVNSTLENVIPFLDKELRTLAWDIPETFCAVFIPVCTVECCDAPFLPEQIRLALTNNADERSVQWTTLNLTSDAQVQWGVAGGGTLPFSSTGTSRTYPQGGWLGILYSATLTGLSPGETYSYRVGSATAGWSPLVNFSLPPNSTGTPAGRPLRIIHIGDMGWGDNSNATINALSALLDNDANAFDMVLHTGDVSYADGQQKSWDVFGRKIESISRRVPYMVGVGNHESVRGV